MKKLALFLCLIVLPVGSWAQPSVGSASYSVDSTTFYFDVILNGIPTGGTAIFRIADPELAFSGSNFERLAVNFDSTTGSVSSQASQIFGTPANDRWPTGPIPNLTIAANGPLSWHIFGSIPHGGNPFVAGDAIRDTVVRFLGNPDFNVANVQVTAATPNYSVGGSISGLSGSITLVNNGSDTLAVPASATGFTFATQLADGASYAVTVSSQPPGQTCTVTGGNGGGGSGTIAGANVTSINVVCVDDVPKAATPVPTMSAYGLVLTALVLFMAAGQGLRTRSRRS